MAVDVKRLRKLLEAATPGPWTSTYEESDRWTSITGQGRSLGDDVWMVCPEVATCEGEIGPDAELIVAARNVLPELLDEVDEARAALDRVRQIANNWSDGPCLSGYRIRNDDSDSECLHCASGVIRRAIDGVEGGGADV